MAKYVCTMEGSVKTKVAAIYCSNALKAENLAMEEFEKETSIYGELQNISVVFIPPNK